MRLISFTVDHGKPEAGVLSGDTVTSFGTDMLAVLASSGPLVPTGSVYGLKDIRLLAPVPRPPKLICIGLNYLDHARETGQTVPAVPTVFNKFTNVVIGPGASIALPKASKFPDYEAELAFVVGPGGRNIPASRAMDHVFGYTIFNDVSARDIQSATSQWLLGKTCDTLDCTPELRHAGRRLIGDTLGLVDASLWISSRRAAGVWLSRRDFQGLWERW